MFENTEMTLGLIETAEFLLWTEYPSGNLFSTYYSYRYFYKKDRNEFIRNTIEAAREHKKHLVKGF